MGANQSKVRGMADAKKEVIKLFERIKEVKKAGMRSRYGVNQSEVYRLYGMIEWILGLEKKDILEEPEGWESVPPLQIKKGLKTAKQRLNLAPVTEGLVKEVNMASGELSDFPKYLELPGPLVREKILGYLNPSDQLSVAQAVPSEVEYLPQPLSFLQFEAVFPILYAKGLLKKKDVRNLKKVDPYFKGFIKKHLEDVNWKKETRIYAGLDMNARGLFSLEYIIELLRMGGSYYAPVSIQPNSKDYLEVLEQLRSCGKSIQNCILELGEDFPQLAEFMISCLQLMPNLESLTVVRLCGGPEIRVHEEELAGIFPDLTALKILRILDWEPNIGVFTRSLFRKYGPQLERLSIIPRLSSPEPAITVQSEHLTILKLNVTVGSSLEGVLSYLDIFRECRLKHLEIVFVSVPDNTCINETLRRLLITVGTHWAQTLESFSIHFQRNHSIPRFINHPFSRGEPNWMVNLEFRKLRSLELRGYPIENSWAFLLLFPALQKFAYYPLRENAASDTDDPMGDDEPFIKLFREKEKMIRSNMWKIFPRLDRIQFFTYGEYGMVRVDGDPFMTLTRKECMSSSG